MLPLGTVPLVHGLCHRSGLPFNRSQKIGLLYSSPSGLLAFWLYRTVLKVGCF